MKSTLKDVYEAIQDLEISDTCAEFKCWQLIQELREKLTLLELDDIRTRHEFAWEVFKEILGD